MIGKGKQGYAIYSLHGFENLQIMWFIGLICEYRVILRCLLILNLFLVMRSTVAV